MHIAQGDKVTFDFTLKFTDGTEVDASKEEPFTITIGEGELLACLERRLLGLAVGDRQRFTIPAAETLTEAGQGSFETFRRADFPADMPLAVGSVIGFTLPSGEEVPGTVIDANSEEILVDFAHPLAGRDLIFEVTVRAVEPHSRSHGRPVDESS